MLSRMTPQQFDELIAFNSIEPIGNENMYQLVALIGVKLVAAWGGDVEDIVKLVDGNATEKKQTQHASPNQAAAFMKAAMGSR